LVFPGPFGSLHVRERPEDKRPQVRDAHGGPVIQLIFVGRRRLVERSECLVPPFARLNGKEIKLKMILLSEAQGRDKGMMSEAKGQRKAKRRAKAVY